MSTPWRVVGFVTALVAAFAVAWGGGRLVGPIDTEPAAHESEASHVGGDDHAGSPDGGNHSDHGATAADVSGLTARADGFTLDLDERTLPAGRTRLAFRVLTSSGRPLVETWTGPGSPIVTVQVLYPQEYEASATNPTSAVLN